MSEASHTIILSLNDEEQQLLDSLAREYGISPAEALRTLLHNAAEIDDALWDRKFAETQDVLKRLGDEAHEEYLAGLTEEFDPDRDIDLE